MAGFLWKQSSGFFHRTTSALLSLVFQDFSTSHSLGLTKLWSLHNGDVALPHFCLSSSWRWMLSVLSLQGSTSSSNEIRCLIPQVSWTPACLFFFTGRTSSSNTRQENGDPAAALGCAYLWVITQKQNIRVCLRLCSGLTDPVALMELSLEFNTHENTEKRGRENSGLNK